MHILLYFFQLLGRAECAIFLDFMDSPSYSLKKWPLHKTSTKLTPFALYVSKYFLQVFMMICERSELWNYVMANFLQLRYLYLFHFICDCLRCWCLNSNNKYSWGQKNVNFCCHTFLTSFSKKWIQCKKSENVLHRSKTSYSKLKFSM